MIMKSKNVIVTLVLFGSLSLFASQNNTYPKDLELHDYLSVSFSNLKEQVCEIQSQYVSITSRLAKIEFDIPPKFQSLSNLFQTSDLQFSVDNNAHIYYDSYELSDFEKFFLCHEGDFYDNLYFSTQFASLDNLIAVSNQVVSLEETISFLISRLNTLSDTISSISSKPSVSQNSLSNLAVAFKSLDRTCSDLTSVIKVNPDGSVVMCQTSPIVGEIEPSGNASLYTLAQNWDRCCSKFRVSTNAFLESVILYCDDPSKMPAPGNVYVSTVIKDELTGNYSFESWHCVNVNTSNFPRCVWTFINNKKIPILHDRDYLLCISKSNGALYPYVTSPFRQGSFYKPFGATEELPPDPPPNSPDPELPRSSPSAQDWFNYLFAQYWEESAYYSKELWSILKFTDDVGFTFSKSGLSVERGNITIAGSEVVTSSSLGDMFVAMLAEHPNALNSEITWNMFCDDLKDMLITTNGGTITGSLTVNNLKLPNDGNWLIGNETNKTDIVINNQDGFITTSSGNLNLTTNGEGTQIKAYSFLAFEDPDQCGKAIITANSDSVVIASNLSQNAIINTTPAQFTNLKYWVEIDSFGIARIKVEENVTNDLAFYYIILKK